MARQIIASVCFLSKQKMFSNCTNVVKYCITEMLYVSVVLNHSRMLVKLFENSLYIVYDFQHLLGRVGSNNKMKFLDNKCCKPSSDYQGIFKGSPLPFQMLYIKLYTKMTLEYCFPILSTHLTEKTNQNTITNHYPRQGKGSCSKMWGLVYTFF